MSLPPSLQDLPFLAIYSPLSPSYLGDMRLDFCAAHNSPFFAPPLPPLLIVLVASTPSPWKLITNLPAIAHLQTDTFSSNPLRRINFIEWFFRTQTLHRLPHC